MYAYLSGVPVVHADVPQQMFSCVANGKYYKKSDVAVLAAVLKGVDITEIFSPERVKKLCNQYHLLPGDSFDLRTGYDLSDEKDAGFGYEQDRQESTCACHRQVTLHYVLSTTALEPSRTRRCMACQLRDREEEGHFSHRFLLEGL